jgi:hypothetical protein
MSRLGARGLGHRPAAPQGLLAAAVSVNDVAGLFSAIEPGDPLAAERLLPLGCDGLRRPAAQKPARESSGQTLQPTALVHEADLRRVE